MLHEEWAELITCNSYSPHLIYSRCFFIKEFSIFEQCVDIHHKSFDRNILKTYDIANVVEELITYSFIINLLFDFLKVNWFLDKHIVMRIFLNNIYLILPLTL